MKIDKYIVIVLLVLIALNLYQWFVPKSVVLDSDSQILMEQINKNQQRLDSIETARPNYEKERDAKLDSLSIMLESLNQNIVRTKDLERYEKQVLFNASDDDNLQYFHDYIDHYRTKRRTGTDTVN